jgi:hypothetical protein
VRPEATSWAAPIQVAAPILVASGLVAFSSASPAQSSAVLCSDLPTNTNALQSSALEHGKDLILVISSVLIRVIM